MKKYILKISLVVVATVLSFSCNDSFLDRQPLDEISNESFWNTENDLAVYNNSLYNLARNDNDVPILMAFDDGFDSHRYGIWMLSGFSDDTAPRHSRHTNYQRVRAGKHSVPNGAFWYGWRGWNFLRAINVGMDNYDNAQISEAAKNKYKAEARLFRGWFYADKISKFGSAQWVDTELNIDDDDVLYGERDDRETVMSNVMDDLKFATANLPEDWGDGGAPGRLNRWAALLVMSRVALFEGTWRKYHGLSGADTWLTEAANAAKDLMDNGPYELYTDPEGRNYNGLHRIPDDLSGVAEVIYWRRYERGIFTNHVQSYHRGYNGGATKSLVEDYLCTDGLPITLSPLYQGDEVYEDIFVNRDPRLRQTVLHPDDQPIYNYGNHDFGVRTYPRLQGMGGQQTYTGYHIIKVFESGSAYRSYNSSQTPAIIMRLGEALLNYAEAKAELGTISQADLDMTVNALRDRAGLPPEAHLVLGSEPVDPRYTAWHSNPLIVEIRRERRIELFMEGFRYDDLRRWGWGKMLENKDYGMRWDAANRAAVDTKDDDPGYVPGTDVTVGFSTIDGVEYIEPYKGTDFENPVFDESKHYLWPMPLSALSQNPNLGQNPGWGSGE
jgi:hypothetical protein